MFAELATIFFSVVIGFDKHLMIFFAKQPLLINFDQRLFKILGALNLRQFVIRNRFTKCRPDGDLLLIVFQPRFQLVVLNFSGSTFKLGFFCCKEQFTLFLV